LPAPALSCPVFAGSGTLLGEDDCAWAKADTRWTVQSGTTGNTTVLHFGGQKELMPGLFLSGAFGFGTQSTQNGNGTAGNGQIYDGSLALKYTNGPWFLAGAIAFSTNQLHLAPSALGLSGDANIYVGAARLRGAYDFAFTGWYLRPRLDLDVIQTWRPAFMLAGPGPSGLGQNALSVDAFDKTRFVASPMIELGGRFDFDERTVARPFLAVGATFLPDNNVTTSVNIAGQAATLGSLQSTGYGPSVLGNVQAGLQLYKTHGFEMKAEYALSVGDSYLSQGASLRGAYHF
jgi:hypothetical protein